MTPSPETLSKLRELEQKATKAPWKITPFKSYDKRIYISGGVEVDNDDVDQRESKANAQLIQALRNAAPELIKAAEENALLSPQNWAFRNELERLRDVVSEQDVASIDAVLEKTAFDLTPEMVMARNEQLNTEVDKLKDEIARLHLELEGCYQSRGANVLIATQHIDTLKDENAKLKTLLAKAGKWMARYSPGIIINDPENLSQDLDAIREAIGK